MANPRRPAVSPAAVPAAAGSLGAPTASPAQPAQGGDFSLDPPEDWPRAPDGSPLDFENMSQEQQNYVFDKYKVMDLESWKSNHAVQTRLDPFMEGKPAYTPWHVRDPIKYDACMERVAHLSGTYLYLEQTSPEVKRLPAPNPQQVPSYGALDQWLRENVWDGNQARFGWTIRLGTRQMAYGHVNYGKDEVQQLHYAKRIKDLRSGVGTPPVQSYVPPPPAPYVAPPPAAAPHPALAPAAPAPVVASRHDDNNLAREDRARADLAEERMKLERERLQFQHQMELERERMAHQIELQRMNARIEALASKGQPIEVSAELAQLRAEVGRLASAPPPSAAAPVVQAAPTPAVVGVASGIPDPPADIALPPGFDWSWNHRAKKWELVQTAAPVAAAPAAAPVTPAAPSMASNELPILTAARESARIAQQTQQAAEIIAGTLGVNLGPGLFAAPAAAASAALASEPAAAKEPEEKEKKNPLFEEEGGLLLRRDKDGQFITDAEHLGPLDLVANGGKIFELFKMAGDYLREESSKKLADEETKARIAKEQAEARKLAAEAELTAAQARERNAQALLTAKRAVGELPVASDGAGEVSSSEQPS